MDSDSDTEEYDEILNKTFFHKYHCIQKLGQGSFGSIYKAEYKGEYFALKFEDKNNGQNLLESEAAIMNYLKGPNIPFVKSYGYTVDYNILVMQLLGKSLEDIFTERGTFSLKTVCMIGTQMVTVLEYIHVRHILHRDIKPDNFVMGLDELSQYVYLLDFGLAKKYRSSTTLVQYPLINKKKLTGTARYASINALKGYEHSRRDDLEAVGYVLLYFLRGSLPWQGQKAKNKDERYQKILNVKMETSASELCKNFPEEFTKYVDYTRNLEYEEEPDYNMLRNLFDNVMKKKNYVFDYIYDWTTDEEKRSRNMASNKSDYNTQYYNTSATKIPAKKMDSKNKELKSKNKNDSIANNIGRDDKKLLSSKLPVNNDNVDKLFNESGIRKMDSNDNINVGNAVKIEYQRRNSSSKKKSRFVIDERRRVRDYLNEDNQELTVCCSAGCFVF